MNKFLKWCKLTYQSIKYYIGIILYNAERDLIESNGSISEKDKKDYRKLHRNPLLEKFYQGQRDEKYMEDFYQILKKADEFIKKSDSTKYGATADKHGMSYGKKDRYGRRHEHYGFFDPKSKHYGKTLDEVIRMETKERRCKDDEYEVVSIYNNEMIAGGLVDVLNEVDTEKNMSNDKLLSILSKAKFPVKIIRNNEKVLNKIEQLTDYLHIKRVDDEHFLLEFFLNRKYKIDKFNCDSEVFKDIVNFENVWICNQFGELESYNVLNFKKRILYDDNYEVFKFFCKKMDIVRK